MALGSECFWSFELGEQSTDRLLLSGKTNGLARFVVCARSL